MGGSEIEGNSTIAETVENGRLKGVFVSENVVNLSKKILNADHIKILSKGLNFSPTPSIVNKA